ncbi:MULTISPECIES: TetR/AcrR family transcriptional regulator [unclassified Paludibacterium]|uniref:TetR/AcrR family transcriptional regulator n=1 Tax=unclassified Paludibacterium TaxID=2618429 RepID=UPI001C05325A|nr:TetR/AcrR family transcriptional regulator [Paludibacterium sp. B53371]
MSFFHHRPKQPERVKAGLISASIELLVGVGLHAVTLDAVCRRAGVSKGALIHHFENRAGLLNAVTDSLLDGFRSRFEQALQQEPPGPGRYTRAYIQTAFTDSADTTKALALLSLAWPYCIEQCRLVQMALEEEDGCDTPLANQLLLLRLTAEGIWYARVRGSPEMDAAKSRLLLQGLRDQCLQLLGMVSGG